MSSLEGKKVLHMDRNPYYGGESASLSLDQLYKKFRGDQKPPASLGRSRDYCIDLCPKFLMACGNLVKILLKTSVAYYLEFQSVSGSYVFLNKKIHKVPASAKEALSSGLMGMFQKRRYIQFIRWINDFEYDEPKTHQGCDVFRQTTGEIFNYFKLEPATQLFTGHAFALFLDDSYLQKPAKDMVDRVKLYAYSVTRYGKSPYIYPKWGLGGLPEGFSRRCAVHGGVYMLNIEEKSNFIEDIMFNDDGRVCGIKSEGLVAKCSSLISDPSYFIGTDKIEKTGRVARCICILSHPIDHTDSNNNDSAQIIIPGSAVPNRKSDIYICMVSSLHNVAAPGKYVAVISGNVESGNPEAELAPAFNLLGKIDEKFFWVTDCYKPVNDPSKDGCFITSSYDATTHFTTTTGEVMNIVKQMTGKELDLSITANPEDLQP